MIWLELAGCSELGEVMPGQFAMVRPDRWDVDPVLARPLSFLGAGGDRAEFLIRKVGRGTRSMSELRQGEPVTMLAPLGNPFPPPSPGNETILVAGGVGLPPLLMWAERARSGSERSEGHEVRFFYGGKTGDDLILLGRLERASDELVLATEDGSMGREGMVTEAVREEIAKGDGSAKVFCCGPAAMMREVAAIAESEEMECLVSLESRMACGRGVCLGCAVEGASGGVFLVCKHGPVVSADEVDWNREVREQSRGAG
jgi:dihydroorotate dehydrogenase electron transfer subunit